MDNIEYILLIPISLSFISCSIYLYIFYRYVTVRLTFAMKYIAVLQLLDLLESIVAVINLLIKPHNSISCAILLFSCFPFLISQTCWVLVLSIYLFKVVFKEQDKDNISLFKPLVFVIFLAFLYPTIFLCFSCNRFEEDVCYTQCSSEDSTDVIISIYIAIIIISYSISIFLVYKILRKIYHITNDSSIFNKSSLYRILLYPNIVIICNIHNPLVYLLSIRGEYNESEIEEISFKFLSYSIGFFNSIVLGFSKELWEAVKFDKEMRKQSLMLAARNSNSSFKRL